MKTALTRLVIFVGTCLMAGCASSGILPTGPDTYSITESSAGFADTGVRRRVYEKANAFCTERGLVMVPVSLDSKEGQLARRQPSATLVFRALKPGDPEIKRPTVEAPDKIIRVQTR